MIDSNTLQALHEERMHALAKYGDRSRSVGEHLLLIEKYFRDAKHAWQNNVGDNRALHELRKLASMTLVCLEEHGCPKRGDEITSHVPELPSNHCPTIGPAYMQGT